jgi:uncharacterized protein YlxW (UPF0749 family)
MPPTVASRWRGQAAIAVAVALVGFLLAVQLRTQQSLGQRLGVEREADLAQLLSDLGQRSDQVLEQIVDLRVRLATQAGSAQQERVLLENARGQLAGLEVLLGLVPVRGPGVVLTITDPQGTVGPEVLLDAVQELRDAGAEAIDIDGRRVVAQTAVAGEAGGLVVGGRRVRAPYRVVAIGDPETLAEAMRIPGGVVDAVTSRPGAAVRVVESRLLRISSLHAPPRLTYARPVQRR